MANENDPGSLLPILQWLVSAAAGAMLTLVAFRTRFVVIEMKLAEKKQAADKEVEDRKAEFERVEAEVMRRLTAIDRRSMMTLQIVVDVAKKVGVDQRLSDTLVRFLTEETVADRSAPMDKP